VGGWVEKNDWSLLASTCLQGKERSRWYDTTSDIFKEQIAFRQVSYSTSSQGQAKALRIQLSVCFDDHKLLIS